MFLFLFLTKKVNLHLFAKNRNINLIKKVVEYRDIEYEEIAKLFERGVYNGAIEFLEFLYKYSIESGRKLDLHWEEEGFFLTCSDSNQLETMKWLWNKAIEEGRRINIHSLNDFAFRWACSKGYIHIAKWLLNLSLKINSHIDIHAEEGYAFKWACYNQHMRLVKWLYYKSNAIGSPIRFEEEYRQVFKKCCRSNLVTVCEWFTKMCPKYRIEIVDGLIIDAWDRNIDIIDNYLKLLKLNKSKFVLKFLKIKKCMDQSDGNCLICLDRQNPFIRCGCSHLHCLSCILRWIQYSNGRRMCTLCKKRIVWEDCKRLTYHP